MKDTAAFDTIRDYLINHFGATTSIKSLTEALVKNGIKTTRATVSKYVQALMDAKILYECNRFDMKSKKSLVGAKKYYLADLSLYVPPETIPICRWPIRSCSAKKKRSGNIALLKKSATIIPNM